MTDLDLDDDVLTVDEALDDMWHLLDLAKGGSKPARRKVNSLLEQIGEADRRVRQDYEDRFAIELLQNAHDACHDADVVGSAWFVLTKSALLVGNQGVPFDAERIIALTTLGVTSKAAGGPRRHVIGYKGVGFSSVFSVTDRPQILSGDVNFGFDEERARQTIESEIGLKPKKVSARSVPFRLDPEDWGEDWEVAQAIMASGAVTVVRLPLRETFGREDALTVLQRSLAPESLLFMPHLDGLNIDLGGERAQWRRRRGKSIGAATVVSLENAVDGQKVSWLVRDDVAEAPRQVANLDDDIWKNVEELNVTVALPWKGNRVDPDRGPQRLHVYFPTDDQTGRSLLIHGDFYVHSSRRSVQDKGPGGEVSRAVGMRAAALIGELAASVAPRGGELLSALAVVEAPASEFTRELNQRIDDELRATELVRPAGGSTLRRPGDLYLLDTHLDEDDHNRLVRALRDPSDLVHFDDDVDERRELLQQLGTPALPVREIAARFSVTKAGGYDDGLELLRRWWNTIPRSQEWQARPGFVSNPLVQDRAGKWRRAVEVRWYERGVPMPPPKLRPAPLLPPSGLELTNFVRNVLGVKSLTSTNLLEHVLTKVGVGEYGATSREAGSLLRFVFELWLAHPEAIRESSQLGVVRVPASDVRGRTIEWRPADEVYLLERLSGDSFAEAMYGPLLEPDFAVPEEAGLEDERVADFLRDLGAHVSPREVELQLTSRSESPSGSGAHFREWLEHPDVESRSRCFTSHHDPTRRFTINTLDRLENVLASRDQTALLALAYRLGQLESPFGSDDRVRCAMSSCSNHRSVLGYRRWLLTTRDWVPVEESGRRSVSTPGRAWFGVPRSTNLVIPSTPLGDQEAERLGCVRFAGPGVGPVEHLLDKLRRRHPARAEASDAVQNTLDKLLDLLDSAAIKASRSAAGTSEDTPWFPVTTTGERTWSRTPLVADLPILDRFDAIDVLPPGQWDGLRARYGLQRASEVLQWTVRVEEGDDPQSPLPSEWRSELVALLSKGADLKRLAKQLGLLAHETVEDLAIEMTFGSQTEVQDHLPFHLTVASQAADQTLLPAKLFTTPRAADDLYGLSQRIAEYLEDENLIDPIASYLTMREQVLKRKRISAERIEEAKALIERYTVEDDAEHNIARSLDELSAWTDRHPTSESDDPGDENPEDPDVDDLDVAWPDQPPERVGAKSSATKSSDDARIVRSRRAGGHPPQSPTHRDPADPTKDGERTEWVVDPNADFTFAPRGERVGARPPAGASTFGPTGGSPGASVGPSSVSPQAVDDRAIAVATAYGEYLGATVVRVDNQNKGWDLEFNFDDCTWPVEVKGMADERDGFILTRNERRAAESENDHRYLIVTGLGGRSGDIVVLESAENPLDDEVLQPMSWLVPGWRAMEPSAASIWRGTLKKAAMIEVGEDE